MYGAPWHLSGVKPQTAEATVCYYARRMLFQERIRIVEGHSPRAKSGSDSRVDVIALSPSGVRRAYET